MTVIPVGAASGGMDMQEYIDEVRGLAMDVPVYANEQWSGDGSITTFLCSKRPINDDDDLLVQVGGATVPIVTNRANLTVSNVYVNYDAGRLVFGAAPAVGTGNITIQKNQVERRDSTISRSLQMGLRAMYPRVWHEYVDTSITLAPLQWDYTLPLAFLGDERIYIIKVELQNIPQGSPQPFLLYRNWEQVGQSTIKLLESQSYVPGATLRVTYAGPYTDLTQVPGRESNLPILYAMGMLLGTRESRRSRADGVTVAAGDSANPPGTAQNAGTWYMRQFEAELQRCSRPIPSPAVASNWMR